MFRVALLRLAWADRRREFRYGLKPPHVRPKRKHTANPKRDLPGVIGALIEPLALHRESTVPSSYRGTRSRCPPTYTSRSKPRCSGDRASLGIGQTAEIAQQIELHDRVVRLLVGLLLFSKQHGSGRKDRSTGSTLQSEADG